MFVVLYPYIIPVLVYHYYYQSSIFCHHYYQVLHYINSPLSIPFIIFSPFLNITQSVLNLSINSPSAIPSLLPPSIYRTLGHGDLVLAAGLRLEHVDTVALLHLEARGRVGLADGLAIEAEAGLLDLDARALTVCRHQLLEGRIALDLEMDHAAILTSHLNTHKQWSANRLMFWEHK
jgi:hypothetical protein